MLQMMFLVFLILQKLWPETQRSSPCTSLEAVSLVWATGPVSIDSFFYIPFDPLVNVGLRDLKSWLVFDCVEPPYLDHGLDACLPPSRPHPLLHLLEAGARHYS